MKKYDVIVVGSGAGGATAAWALATRGASVLLLEAGLMLIPAKDFKTHTWPWELPFRGEGKPGAYDGLWKINEYTISSTPTRARRSTAPIPSFTGPACAPSWGRETSCPGRLRFP